MKPIASLSLDLDNKWSYLKTHGDKEWFSYPSYLDVVVPRVLSFLKEQNLTITFFVVGQDASRPENHAALKMLSDAGHEMGNHSFNHEPWLHLYSEAQIESELAQTEEAIQAVTGQRPVGFRGPGYSLSETVLRVLKRRGYQYDCSTLPTYLGPLARAYYFMTVNLSADEKEQRKKLFGTFAEGFRPVKPYQWKIGDKEMLEIPVTTMPIFKIPTHCSYVLYLSMFSKPLAILYFRITLLLCRLTGTRPSLLLHPLDFLDSTDVSGLDFFPAMKMPAKEKLEVLGKMLKMMSEQYRIVPLKACAAEFMRETKLPLVEARFGVEQAGSSNVPLL